MSLSKYKNMPSYDFPEEILSEIFKRLPVKSVVRCGSVQKSWYHLVKSSMFITLHCNHQEMRARDNPKYLLFHDASTRVITVRSDDAQCQEYCTFDYLYDFPFHECYALSNGLICVSSMLYRKPDYDPNIYVWNPLVQVYKTIGRSPLSVFTPEEVEWMALAFGFLPQLNDYVVVHVVKLEPDPPDPSDPDPPDPYEFNPHTVEIGVYSLNTSSWKTMFQDDVHLYGLCTNQSVFVNGTAFWVGEGFECQFVMYFDTKRDILGEIVVPESFGIQERQFDDPVIHPFGQSIAYFLENDESHQLDIWVLKCEIVDEFSWEKILSVSLSENVWADVLGIRNNSEPILPKSNKLISYDLDTHEPYDFVNSWDRLTPYSRYQEGSKPDFVITPFAETLLWLDK